MTKRLAIAAVIAAAAFALGRATAPAPASPTIVAASAAPAPAAAWVAGPPCVARLGDDDLRRLRDEVMAASAPGDAPTPPPAELAPPAPEQVAAGAALAHRIDAAITAGRWTDDDVAFLRASEASTGADDYAAGLQRLAAAVNRGDVRVETAGAPF